MSLVWLHRVQRSRSFVLIGFKTLRVLVLLSDYQREILGIALFSSRELQCYYYNKEPLYHLLSHPCWDSILFAYLLASSSWLINSILPSPYHDRYWLGNPQCLFDLNASFNSRAFERIVLRWSFRSLLAFTFVISWSYFIVCESSFFLTFVEVLELGLVTFNIFSPALCIFIDHDIFNLYVRLTQDVSEARYVHAHIVRCFFCPVLYHWPGRNTITL